MPLLADEVRKKRLEMKKLLNSPEEFQDHTTGDQSNGKRGNENQILELFETDFLKLISSRRDFLKVFGFSFASAALAAGCKRPVQYAIPYVIQPPEITPGKSLYFASSFYDGHEYSGVLVKTRDGRPVKIEGNPLSEFNREGTTARVQASVLSLYDDARLKSPMLDQKVASWETIDETIINDLALINSEGGEIVLLTSTIISPSTVKLIKEFGAGFKNFRWVQYDALSYSAILEANSLCFGKTVIPDYNFENADLVVSVNADFLGSWVAPVHFISKYVVRRKLNNGEKSMLRHVQYESGMSLTGSNADIRRKIKPSEEKVLLADLYNKIAGKTGAETIPGVTFREDLSELAESLIASMGRSIVVSGTNNIETQIIVNGINSLLGNYSDCIDLKNHINIAAGIDSAAEALVNDLNDGKVSGLFMYNVNPVYDYPNPDKFLEGIKKTGLTVNMAVALNETVGNAKFECPVPHYLESWNDAEITPGQMSLCQPAIHPLFDTRSFQDSLLKWSGNPVAWHDYIVANWEKEYFPKSNLSSFKNFWDSSLGNGVFRYSNIGEKVYPFDKTALLMITNPANNPSSAGYEIVIYESVALGTGMYANNPWLMELPDPITRHCWDNVASISPSDATKLGIVNGHLLKVGDGLVLPAFIQPGQADGTISVAAGYGHMNSGPVANNIGVNLYSYAKVSGVTRNYGFTVDQLENTFKENQLALTQEHSSMEGRPIVRETVLSNYRDNPASGNEFHEDLESHNKTLYADVKYDGFHWGIAIDLNACVGCNSCVIACQAENNIPVVGKDEVRRRRIMHWIKIDRYYSDTPDDPKVYFQPLMCQHCDNAPCENVCPVGATNHSSEGLNQMTYNRCVGTKYCINNCPYKVRRFNWYRYTNNKAFDFNTASDLGKMVLNPDVTVRERGVVEKCSFCVQRIQEKKLQAKLENRTLNDGEIKTACMQACPAGAIIFGDLNDKESKVSVLFNDPRRYNLLKQLHTLPSVGFLTKVWNDEDIKS
jgi:molybdopterin-containing oxidoreductase family iron-sulfur binding subunit